MQTVTENLFKTTVHDNDAISIKTQPGKNPWFKDECCQYQNRFLSFLNIYRKCASDENRVLLVKARSEYTCTIQHVRKDT